MFDIKMASSTPDTNAPANKPPSTLTEKKPATTGAVTASSPGSIICLIAAWVEI